MIGLFLSFLDIIGLKSKPGMLEDLGYKSLEKFLDERYSKFWMNNKVIDHIRPSILRFIKCAHKIDSSQFNNNAIIISFLHEIKVKSYFESQMENIRSKINFDLKAEGHTNKIISLFLSMESAFEDIEMKYSTKISNAWKLKLLISRLPLEFKIHVKCKKPDFESGQHDYHKLYILLTKEAKTYSGSWICYSKVDEARVAAMQQASVQTQRRVKELTNKWI